MTDDFFVWGCRNEENSTQLADLEGVDRPWDLVAGIPLAGTWGEAVYPMDPTYPDHIALFDGVDTIEGLVVVSKAIRDFLAGRAPAGIEFLPIGIRNHKGRIASRDYAILNPHPLQDALDVAASGPTYSRIRKTDISEVERLVIDPDRVAPEVEVFRLAAFTDVVVVRRRLAEAMTAEGFRGIRWIPASAYPER